MASRGSRRGRGRESTWTHSSGAVRRESTASPRVRLGTMRPRARDGAHKSRSVTASPRWITGSGSRTWPRRPTRSSSVKTCRCASRSSTSSRPTSGSCAFCGGRRRRRRKAQVGAYSLSRRPGRKTPLVPQARARRRTRTRTRTRAHVRARPAHHAALALGSDCQLVQPQASEGSPRALGVSPPAGSAAFLLSPRAFPLRCTPFALRPVDAERILRFSAAARGSRLPEVGADSARPEGSPPPAAPQKRCRRSYHTHPETVEAHETAPRDRRGT